MSGLVFTLLLAAASMGTLDSILTGGLGFREIVKGESWRGRVREGPWSVDVFVRRLGSELQFLIPDGSVPREVCEKVVKKLSARLYSLITAEPFKPEDVRVVGPTPSFCYHCLDPIYMPFRCHRCGGFFCGTHRLPERHDCPGGEGGKMRLPSLKEELEEVHEEAEKAIFVKRLLCG